MAHLHKLIDFTATAFIVHKNKVLLIFHRTHNFWLPVGGHIELDEDPEEALLREVREESGLEIELIGKKPNILSEGVKFLHVPSFLDIHRINDEHRHVGMHYIARSTTDKVKLEKEEHKEIKWFTKSELQDPKYNIKPDVKYYALQALDQLGE